MSDYDNPTAEAIDLWMEIIGVTPEVRTYSIGEMSRKIEFRHLQEALELDHTEITANLMLGAYARSYFKNKAFSQYDLMFNQTDVLATLEKPRRLLEILDRPEIIERRDKFISNLRQALDDYGAGDREDVQALLEDHDAMAFLRRDALRSMANLSVHQFLDGDPEPDDVKPVYYRFVHQWFNVNSMLDFAASQAPGVSLNLIRDPNDFESYFSFSIRNGGRLFVLTDVPKHEHPLQPMLSRRPDREMDRRIARNWFPYELMGLAYNEESGRLYFDRSEEKSLVVGQNKALPLRPISALAAQEVVWIAMMFGLIVDRFWRNGHTEKLLSYTAEMMQVQDRMITAADKANLPVKGYTKINLPPLTVADVVQPDGDAEKLFGKRTDFTNEWLEKRYASQVSDESLNVLASPERVHQISLETGEIKDERAVAVSSPDDRKISLVSIEKLRSTSFGTREALESDRMFVARYNYAKQISALANNEYERRHDEIKKWYTDHVDQNLDVILKWAGTKILWMREENPSEHRAGIRMSITPSNANNAPGKREMTHLRTLGYLWDHSNTHKSIQAYGAYYPYGWGYSGPPCAITEGKSAYVYTICPANPKEIALVAGCEVGDLPDVLQNYTLQTPNTANYLLDRIDPVDWNLNNPWTKFDVRVSISLSKRGLNKLDKTQEPPSYWVENGWHEEVGRTWKDF